MADAYKDVDKLKTVADRLEAAMAANPQVTMFRVDASGKLHPAGELASASPRDMRKVDVCVIGAELSSLSTAVQCAERGLTVAIVYAGPLGGLSADSGGNMRYFDVMNRTSHPFGQTLVWSKGLGIDLVGIGSWVSIPTDTDARLKRFLETYRGRIQLVPTRSFDDLWVEKNGDGISAVDTPEGTGVQAAWYIDGDPESRVAEKAGVPYSVETPHMSDGMTFDVLNLSDTDLDRLSDDSRVEANVLEKLVGVTDSEVSSNPAAAHLRDRLKENIAADFCVTGPSHSYGYCGLAAGFSFYMACREIREPSADLKWLNGHRFVSGFNVARYQGEASFNSISYRFIKDWLQHSHSLTTDASFAPIRRTEIPALETYLRIVTEDQGLTVRMPEQFYIRKSTAFFKLLHPYVASEFNGPKTGPYYTHYPMDLRDLYPRDKASWPRILEFVKAAKGKNFWNARASAAETTVANLFLVNKCGVTPTYSGGMRVEQAAINLGAAVADQLASRKGR